MSEPNGTRPGVLHMVSTLVRYPFERMQLAEEQARHQRLAVEFERMQLENVVRRIGPDPDEISLTLGDAGQRDLDPESAKTLRARAIEASYKNGHCVGYLRSLQRFVMGKGPTFAIEDVNEELEEAIWEAWDAFREHNDWDTIEDEFGRRLWRDGEYFIREFPQRRDGPPDGWEMSTEARQHLVRQRVTFSQATLKPKAIPAGTLILRFIPPDQIDDPSGTISHGILTAADDVCTVLGYCWAPKVDQAGRRKIVELIPASEIRHTKIRVDQDVKRGRSMLEPILKRARQFDDWVEYRLLLNLMRTSFVWFKKIVGSGAQVSAIRDAQQTGRDAGLNDRRLKAFKPGSTVTHNAAIEYENKGPNLQATDAQHDGRMFQLAMAAPTGLPEYMFTGDASNANFASTMVAESPAVREFEDWQDILAGEFRWVFRRAIACAAEFGDLGITPEDAMKLDVEVTFPPMVARSELDHTRANEIRHRNKVISRQSWREDDGIDHETEEERTADEMNADIDLGLLLPAVGGGGDEGGN